MAHTPPRRVRTRYRPPATEKRHQPAFRWIARAFKPSRPLRRPVLGRLGGDDRTDWLAVAFWGAVAFIVFVYASGLR